MLLRFHSDDTIHNKGFKVVYQALDADEEEQVIKKEKFLSPASKKDFHQKPTPPVIGRMIQQGSQGVDLHSPLTSSPSASYRSHGVRRHSPRYNSWRLG
jgi:hypothetical protein